MELIKWWWKAVTTSYKRQSRNGCLFTFCSFVHSSCSQHTLLENEHIRNVKVKYCKQQSHQNSFFRILLISHPVSQFISVRSEMTETRGKKWHLQMKRKKHTFLFSFCLNLNMDLFCLYFVQMNSCFVLLHFSALNLCMHLKKKNQFCFLFLNHKIMHAYVIYMQKVRNK